MREPMKTKLKKSVRLFQVLSEILEGCFYLNLSHRSIVSEVLYEESFYGDYRIIFWHYFEIVCLWNVFRWIYCVLLSAAVVMAVLMTATPQLVMESLMESSL